MLSPLFLESLETRALLTVSVAPTHIWFGPVFGDVGASALAHVPAVDANDTPADLRGEEEKILSETVSSSGEVTNLGSGMDFRAALLGSEDSAGLEHFFHDVYRFKVEMVVAYREIACQEVDFLMLGMRTGALDSCACSGSSGGSKSGTGIELSGEHSTGRTGPAAETQVQPSSLSAITGGEILFPLDGVFLTEGTADLALPGPFSDAVFLDGWRDGVPAPRAELVPTSNRDLTIIPAYLVNSPATLQPSNTTQTANAEQGLTHFIVGFQGARAERPALRTVERREDVATPSIPQEPGRVTMVPSDPTDPTCTTNEADKRPAPPLPVESNPRMGPRDTETEDETPSPVEPSAVPDDADGGE